MNFSCIHVNDAILHLVTPRWRRYICTGIAGIIVWSFGIEQVSVAGLVLLGLSLLGAAYSEKWEFNRETAVIRYRLALLFTLKQTEYSTDELEAIQYETINAGYKHLLRYSLLFRENIVTIEVRNVRKQHRTAIPVAGTTDNSFIPGVLASFLQVPCRIIE